MNKKNETIVIRLNSDTKEAFRSLCDSKSVSMSDTILNQINKILLDSEMENQSSNFSAVLRERAFYKKELDVYKRTFSEISKMLITINRNNLKQKDELYCEIFLENFNKIKQFDDYELIKSNYKYSAPDFIAVNKTGNHKLLIELRIESLNNMLIGPKAEHYKQLCNKFKDDADLMLVIITQEPINEQTKHKIEKLSKKIGYEMTVYSFDEIFDFLI